MNSTGRRHELARLGAQIKTLPLELQNLRQSNLETPEVDAEERILERPVGDSRPSRGGRQPSLHGPRRRRSKAPTPLAEQTQVGDGFVSTMAVSCNLVRSDSRVDRAR